MKNSFNGSIKNTVAVCNGLLVAALANSGYEVFSNGGYFEAFNDEHALAILPVSRCLSNKNSTETTVVKASSVGVKKLCEKYGSNGLNGNFDAIVGDASLPGLLCIGFCTAKYSYEAVDITVVPLQTIVAKSESGGVYAIGEKTQGYYFDFAKVPEGVCPDGAILRCEFVLKG